MKSSQLSKPVVVNIVIFVVCILTLVGCKPQNGPASEASDVRVTLASVLPSVAATNRSVTATTSAIINSTPTVRPTYTQTPTPIPKPTSTRRPATATPMPTATSQFFIISSNLNEPECDRPESLKETKIDSVNSPFCIVWLDEFDDEQGFQIFLTYYQGSQSSERFAYEVEANVTQLIVPESHAPRLTESLERCMSHNSYM